MSRRRNLLLKRNGNGIPRAGLLAYFRESGGTMVDTIGLSARDVMLAQYGLFASGDYLIGQIASDVTVVVSEGDGTITISEDRLDYTATKKLWSFELSNGSKYSHPTLIDSTTAIWYDLTENKRDLYLTNDTALDANTHCAESISEGSDTLNQDGFSYRENIVQSILFVVGNADFEATDSNGFTPLRRNNANIGSRAIDAPIEDLAKNTNYSARLHLRAHPDSPDNIVEFGFLNLIGHTAEKVSGPGTITSITYGSVGKWIRAEGLSTTETTVVDVHISSAVVGVTEMMFGIYGASVTSPSIGDGCLVKNIQVCRGDTINEFSAAFSVELARYHKSEVSAVGSGQHIMCFGDSQTTNYPQILRGFLPRATIESNAHGGYRSDALEPLFDSEVVASGAEHCILVCGTNDMVQGMTATWVQTYVTSMVNKATSAGIGVTLSTIPPLGGSDGWTAGKQSELEAFNTWVLAYGAANDIQVMDLYGHMVASSGDGIYADFDYGGHVHFNDLGSRRFAELVSRHVPGNSSAGDCTGAELQYPGRVKYSPTIIPDGGLDASDVLLDFLGSNVDLSQFTVTGDESLSVVDGRLRLTYGPDGSKSTGVRVLFPSIEVGETYIVESFGRYKGTNGSVGLQISTDATDAAYLLRFYSFGDADYEVGVFTATASNNQLAMYGGFGTAGSYVEYDGIRIKKFSSWAVPKCLELYAVDQAAGGDFFYDSSDSDSPIQRANYEWLQQAFVNNNTDGRVNIGPELSSGVPKRVAIYNTTQVTIYDKIQKYIGNG